MNWMALTGLVFLLASLLAPIVATGAPVPTTVMKPRAHKIPTIVKRDYGMHYIENPMLYPVVVRLDCGADWETIETTIPARVTEVQQILDGNGKPGFCFIASWRKAE